jgi:hypothetical protein
MNPIEVVIEYGKKRTFASALDWPGWSRSGKDEESALGSLLDYGSRYAGVLQHRNIEFQPPSDSSAFTITERLQGGVGTDFGAPEVPAEAEKGKVSNAELERFKSLLLAGIRSGGRAGYRQRVTHGSARRRARPGKDHGTRHRRGSGLFTQAGLESGGDKRKEHGSRTPAHTPGDPEGAGVRSKGRAARARSARWEDLAAKVFRPPGSLACARSRLGDRRPNSQIKKIVDFGA